MKKYLLTTLAFLATITATAQRRALGPEIKPLLNCLWDQGAPYYFQTPKTKDSENKQVFTLTGCPATALAQVAFTIQYPKSIGALKGYTSKDTNVPVSDLPATTFDYTAMQATYTGKETESDAAAQAVAKLMRYCGQALQLDYGAEFTGGSILREQMVNTLGYSVAVNEALRSDYTTAEWEQMVYDELKAGRPVLYSGHNEANGHFFVIDGYDGEGKFHVNWGWAGNSNGYFDLDDLTPSKRGNGGGSSENGYNIVQYALFNVRAPQEGDVVPEPIVTQNSYIDNEDATTIYTATRSSASEHFSVKVAASISVQKAKTATTEIGWALYDKAGNMVGSIFNTEKEISLIENKHTHRTITLQFGKDITSGTYELQMVYRLKETDAWKKAKAANDDSSIDRGNVLIVTFDGDTDANILPYSEMPDNYTINSVSFKGDYVEGRPMTASINWTKGNFNLRNENRFYVFLDDNKSDKGVVGSYIDRGATQTLQVVFKPETAGQHTFKLAYDSEGKHVFYTHDAKLELSKQLEQKLSSTIASDDIVFGKTDADKDMIKGNQLKGELRFTNNGSNTYDDYVVITFAPLTEDDKSDGEDIILRKKVNIVAGQSADVPFEFTNLKSNQKYMFYVTYYTKVDNVPTTSDAMELLTLYTGNGTGIERPSTPRLPNTSVYYTLDGKRVNGTPTKKGIYIVNGQKIIVNK